MNTSDIGAVSMEKTSTVHDLTKNAKFPRRKFKTMKPTERPVDQFPAKVRNKIQAAYK